MPLSMTEKEISVSLLESLMDCDQFRAEKIIDDSKKHLGTDKTFNDIIPAALLDLGEKWSKGEAALTQVYAASKIIEAAMDKLPIQQVPCSIKCKVVVGALDYHALGKNIIARFLRAGGVEVIDLGISVTPERLAQTAIENGADALLVSALMVHACFDIERIREMFDNKNVKIPIMVGGAPFNFDKELWSKVGANAMGNNTCDVIRELKGLLNK